MKKPRPDSKLEALDLEQKQALCNWLLAAPPMSYDQVAVLCEKELGISTSRSALGRFYQSYCAQELLALRRRAASMADEIATEAQKEPGKFDAATISALKQKAFELCIAPNADPSDLKALFMVVLKAGDQDIKRADLELRERQLEQRVREYESKVDQTKDALDNTSLTPDQREARIKSIFGLG